MRIYTLFIFRSPQRNKAGPKLRHRTGWPISVYGKVCLSRRARSIFRLGFSKFRGYACMKQLIFVVEDDIDARELARQCLEAAGYIVHTFSTANVIQEAEGKHPSLMLITMMMPDGNGLDLCRSIRENHALAKTPIVFLIPEGAEEHRALALESGGDDCIVKPF